MTWSLERRPLPSGRRLAACGLALLGVAGRIPLTTGARLSTQAGSPIGTDEVADEGAVAGSGRRRRATEAVSSAVFVRSELTAKRQGQSSGLSVRAGAPPRPAGG